MEAWVEGVKKEGGLGRVDSVQLVPLLNLDLDFC